MRAARLLATALGTALLAAATAAPAEAAPGLGGSTTVSTRGSSVTATVSLTATPSRTVALAGVCARDSAGRDIDPPARPDVRLTSTATRLSSTLTLAAGTYTFFACVLEGNTWTNVGAVQRVTVTAPPSTPVAPPVQTGGTTPGGEAMPVGDLAGWKQVFADDFATAAPLGGFPGSAYSSRWTGYQGFKDTSGRGTYSTAETLSVTGGALDVNLRTTGGRVLAAAPVPLLDGAWGGWTYGRYSVRFRADAVAGYKTAWLLWPDSGDWADGEIDFPEGDLTDTVHGFVHQPGNPQHNALAVDTGVRTASGWHTATIEWLPGGVTFLLDGRTVGRTTVSPSRPMHLVLQTETSGSTTAPAGGHVQVDWLTMYRRA